MWQTPVLPRSAPLPFLSETSPPSTLAPTHLFYRDVWRERKILKTKLFSATVCRPRPIDEMHRDSPAMFDDACGPPQKRFRPSSPNLFSARDTDDDPVVPTFVKDPWLHPIDEMDRDSRQAMVDACARPPKRNCRPSPNVFPAHTDDDTSIAPTASSLFSSDTASDHAVVPTFAWDQLSVLTATLLAKARAAEREHIAHMAGRPRPDPPQGHGNNLMFDAEKFEWVPVYPQYKVSDQSKMQKMQHYHVDARTFLH